MNFEYKLPTKKADFYNITTQVREAISNSGISDGICLVFSPHTTAGITINENADLGGPPEQDAKRPTRADVVYDMLLGLDKAFPDRREFRHGEGNSAAHLKASGVGSSVTLIIADGKPVLGTWQSVYFCEFDPPRNRKFYVKVISG